MDWNGIQQAGQAVGVWAGVVAGVWALVQSVFHVKRTKAVETAEKVLYVIRDAAKTAVAAADQIGTTNTMTNAEKLAWATEHVEAILSDNGIALPGADVIRAAVEEQVAASKGPSSVRFDMAKIRTAIAAGAEGAK